MNIPSSYKNYERGEISQAATAVIAVYNAQNEGLDIPKQYCDEVDFEFKRLLDNMMQRRNEWGDLVQLAGLVIFLCEGYVPKGFK